jgi:NAD kinase
MIQKIKQAREEDFLKRTRLLVSVMKCNFDMTECLIMSKHIALNEVVLEETTGAKTCVYQMKLNNYLDMGKIKSSGIIVSTGTGSTGILLSARRPKFFEIKSAEELKEIN